MSRSAFPETSSVSLRPPPLRTAHGEGVLSTRARDPAKAVAAAAPALELQPAVEHRLVQVDERDDKAKLGRSLSDYISKGEFIVRVE